MVLPQFHRAYSGGRPNTGRASELPKPQVEGCDDSTRLGSLQGFPQHVESIGGESWEDAGLALAPKSLEPRPSLFVERVLDPESCRSIGRWRSLGGELGDEARCGIMLDELACCVLDRAIGGDDGDTLLRTALRGESFDQIVGVCRIPDGQPADRTLVSYAVEHDNTRDSSCGDEARQLVDQLLA